MVRLGIDLETFRQEQGLSYQGLADLIGIKQNRQAQAYAVGEVWPGTEMLEQIRLSTRDEVDIFAMHQRRLRWLRDNGKLRRGPVPLAGVVKQGTGRPRSRIAARA
jgi:hypothetical protein